MTMMLNPFDAGGYGLAEMTQAINLLPNVYTRLGQLGLFRRADHHRAAGPQGPHLLRRAGQRIDPEDDAAGQG